MKIIKIKTKSDDEVSIEKFNVLVGANNVGKSQTLKDIHDKLVKGPGARSTIVKEIFLERPQTFEDLLEGLTVVDDPENIDHHLIRGIGSNLTSGEQIRVQIESLRSQFVNSSTLDFTFGNISKYRVSYLDASSRLQVARTAGSHNPHTQPPQNLLQGLFASEQGIEDALREAFQDTFGMDIRLDYSGMTQLTMRVADEFSEIDADPRKAYPLFSKHGKLDDQGDGFRSFVGVVLSLLLSKGRIILLDEPEAFLHPAQARQLGHWIAEHSAKVPGQIIVATHNSHFLAGILSSNKKVGIYRLNRTGNYTQYAQISSKATSNLATSPLLSSQRVLEAIFHKGVVVCEADADRSIYQTVAVTKHRNQDIFFVHAHNKQTIPRVIELLRDAHIPVCAITDIDIVNSEGDLKRVLESLAKSENLQSILELRAAVSKEIEETDDGAILHQLTESVVEFLQQLQSNQHDLSGARGALNRLRRQATSWQQLKVEGINAIEGQAKNDLEALLQLARESGLFIVPVGELEGWMELGTARKNVWIVLALEALHKDQCSEELSCFVRDAISYLEITNP